MCASVCGWDVREIRRCGLYQMLVVVKLWMEGRSCKRHSVDVQAGLLPLNLSSARSDCRNNHHKYIKIRNI